MGKMEDATGSIVNKLQILNDKASNIAGVVKTINKVADQTNLLSVNAAIEAEKAGEYGVGFLVVAREIRRLADQTASATLDIEQMVQQMHSAVSAGVMEMDKFSEQVRTCISQVSQISGQMGEIIGQVQAVDHRQADAVEGQGIFHIFKAVFRHLFLWKRYILKIIIPPVYRQVVEADFRDGHSADIPAGPIIIQTGHGHGQAQILDVHHAQLAPVQAVKDCILQEYLLLGARRDVKVTTLEDLPDDLEKITILENRARKEARDDAPPDETTGLYGAVLPP